MKNVIFIPIFFFLCFSAQAQTKLISHKSHSGSKANFKTALDANLFDMGVSNFGEPGWFDAPRALDSIVHVNDSIVFVHGRGSVSDDWNERQNERKWKPFIDTLVHHPLFSQKHALQNIRMKMRQYYEFRNWVDDVKFVGYDDEILETEKVDPNAKKEIQMTPQHPSILDIDEPKECTKPTEKEKMEKATNQTPKSNQGTSYHIKKEDPKPVFVVNQEIVSKHTTETAKEASTIQESKTGNHIFMTVFGIFGLSILLGFLFLKKA